MSKSRWLGNNDGGTKDARRGTRNEERGTTERPIDEVFEINERQDQP